MDRVRVVLRHTNEDVRANLPPPTPHPTFFFFFTFQPERDESGAAIALFTANRHYPVSVDHQTTLQAIVFQLDGALEELEILKAGLVFIYDMSGSKYSNFDYELSKKILSLLKVMHCVCSVYYQPARETE